MKFTEKQVQVGADGTRFVHFKLEGQVGGIYLTALLFFLADGRVVAVSDSVRSQDGVFTAVLEDSTKNGKWSTATYRFEVSADVVAVAVGFNTITDRYGWSGTFAEQFAALQAALPGATPADLLKIGQVHYPDQFARWVAGQIKVTGRQPVTFQAWQSGNYPTSTRRLGDTQVDGSFRKLLRTAFGAQHYYGYEALDGAEGHVTLRVWAFDESGQAVSLG